jgi:hypothetical protein
MTCRTASGGSGSYRGLSQVDQKVAQRVQIIDGGYNAGSHYSLNINAAFRKQRRGIWALMRKGQRRKSASNRDIESSDTKSFWYIVWVYCFKLLRLIGHPSFLSLRRSVCATSNDSNMSTRSLISHSRSVMPAAIGDQHPHREVLAFGVGRADMLGMRVAGDRATARPKAFGWVVAPFR